MRKKIAQLATARQAGVDGVCEDDPIERGLVNAHILDTIGQNMSEPEYDDIEVDGQHKLSPKEAEKTGLFTALQTRFEANMHLHRGINWNDVKISLEANPNALWSVAQMEIQGHKPDVYHDSKQYYYLGTCSKESPESARNCVYDKKAVDWLKKNSPDTLFKGSAVEMAKAMGVKLMSPKHYEEILQIKQIEDSFDENTRSWLLTRSNVRSIGSAYFGGCPPGDITNVYIDFDLSRLSRRRGWRGSLKVKKVTA